MEFDIEEYRTQRLLREKRRKEFINRFEVVKAKLIGRSGAPQPSLSHHAESHASAVSHPAASHEPKVEKKPVSQAAEPELAELESENRSLKEQLAKAEERSGQKLGELKKEINSLKENYLKEMEKITQLSQHEKQQAEKKMRALVVQIKQAQAKNEEIEGTNKSLLEEAAAGEKLFQTYLVDIEKEYKEKLVEFEQILKESREKIDDMEKNFNEQELVESALKNPKLMEAVLSSGKGQASTASRQQYETILKSKSEIVEELMNNSKLKEAEIKRIKELTDKFKTMFETLNAEKKQLIEDNVNMSNELLEIKNLFAQTLGEMEGGEGDDDDEDEEQDEGDEEEQEKLAS